MEHSSIEHTANASRSNETGEETGQVEGLLTSAVSSHQIQQVCIQEKSVYQC